MDPVEKIIADALDRAGISYLTGDNPGNDAWLDFYLPEQNLYIEVKQFHSERIARQMARAPNVIAIQGIEAATWFAAILSRRPVGPGPFFPQPGPPINCDVTKTPLEPQE